MTENQISSSAYGSTVHCSPALMTMFKGAAIGLGTSLLIPEIARIALGYYSADLVGPALSMYQWLLQDLYLSKLEAAAKVVGAAIVAVSLVLAIRAARRHEARATQA